MASNSDERGEYRVVRVRKGQRARRFTILLLFSVGALVGGFLLGMAQNQFRLLSLQDSSQELQQSLEQLRAENAKLQRQAINLGRGHAIDQQSLAEARKTIEQLENRITRLKGDVTFYRNIMAPATSSTGLQVQSASLRQMPGTRRFSYKLVLAQIGDNRKFIQGVAAVNLIGTHNSKKEVLPLRDVSSQVKELGIDFKFRYFQDIEGEMVLPADFVPEEIQVVAQAQGSASARVERTFQWRRISEAQANAGQK